MVACACQAASSACAKIRAHGILRHSTPFGWFDFYPNLDDQVVVVTSNPSDNASPGRMVQVVCSAPFDYSDFVRVETPHASTHALTGQRTGAQP